MPCLKELASVFSETFVLMGKLKRLSENGDLKKKKCSAFSWQGKWDISDFQRCWTGAVYLKIKSVTEQELGGITVLSVD